MKILGLLLIALAMWQLIVAVKIGRIAKSDIPEGQRQEKIRRLNRLSKVVQFVALVGVSVFIFREWK